MDSLSEKHKRNPEDVQVYTPSGHSEVQVPCKEKAAKKCTKRKVSEPMSDQGPVKRANLGPFENGARVLAPWTNGYLYEGIVSDGGGKKFHLCSYIYL